VIYNGVHYDALAITPHPNASSWDEDVTEFNPRTKKGKMILAAARQLVSGDGLWVQAEAAPCVPA